MQFLHSYKPRARAERLIAIGRLMLAGSSLVAIYLDPTVPARYSDVAYSLLAAYLGYAMLITLMVWRAPTALTFLPLITQVIDVIAFSVFMYFTEAPTSPFFVYFTFSLVCGTMRWRWPGALGTAGISLSLFLGMGFYTADVLQDPEFELNRFLIRSVYLSVMALLLGYMGEYEDSLKREISQLASWQGVATTDIENTLREALKTGAAIIGAPRAVVIWEQTDEPFVHAAAWSSELYRSTREPPSMLRTLVAAPLAENSFICQDSRQLVASVLYSCDGRLQFWNGSPLDADLQNRFAMDKSVLSTILSYGRVKGRIFFLDKPSLTSDDLMLGEIVANVMGTQMEGVYMLKDLRDMAAAEERVQVARDVHDSLLQSLPAIALQLESARRLLIDQPKAGMERVAHIQRQIEVEQQNLRAIFRNLRTAGLVPQKEPDTLSVLLDDLVKRLKQRWDVQVELRLEQNGGSIPERMFREIYSVVWEAVVNAARHGRASMVDVLIRCDHDSVAIEVRDNGSGFYFSGYYNHATLKALKLGPETIKERIAPLGGSLAIESSERGARIEILLPITPGGLDVH